MTTLALSAPVGVFAVPQVKMIPSTTQVQLPSIATRPEPADEELISAICLGAEWAIELLYQRYYRLAYALAYRILCDSTAAEDIVQEAFLSIWRKAASYLKQHGSVYSWIQAIVHHRAIDKVRSSANRDRNYNRKANRTRPASNPTYGSKPGTRNELNSSAPSSRNSPPSSAWSSNKHTLAALHTRKSQKSTTSPWEP